MSEFLSSLLAAEGDYLAFIALAVLVLGGLHAYLWRRFETIGPWYVFVGYGLVVGVGWWQTGEAGQRAQTAIRDLLVDMAPVMAQAMEDAGHAKVRLDAAPDDPAYLRLIEIQKRLLSEVPRIADIYTMRRLPDGRYVFVVDSETDYDRNGRYEGEREQRTPIGQAYTEMTPVMARAFAGEISFDPEPSTDLWGTWVSATAPLHGPDGAIEGVVGIDFDASRWLEARTHARHMVILIVAALLIVLQAGAASLAFQHWNLAAMSRSEEEVRAAKERLDEVINTAVDGVVLTDHAGRVLSLNARARQILACAAEEALGRPVAELLAPSDGRAIFVSNLTAFLHAIPLGEPSDRLEVNAVRANGESFVAELAASAFRSPSGDGYSIFLRDITAAKNAERDRLALRLRLESSQRLGKLGTYELELATGQVAISAQAREIFGLPEHLALVRWEDLQQRIHPADLEAHEAGLRRTVEHGVDFASELRLQCPGGDVRHAHVRGQPLRDAVGRITGVGFSALDVSELVRATEAARIGRRQFETLFETALSALVVVGHDGRVWLANEQTELLFGRPKSEINGQEFSALMRQIALSIEDGRAPALRLTTAPMRLHGLRAGQPLFLDLHVREIDTEAGPGWVAQFDDVTSRELARQTELRTHRLESLGTMSIGVAHDVNNALTPITMSVGVLRAKHPESRVIIDALERCSNRATAMVKQLLMFAGATKGEREQVDSVAVFQSAVDEFRGNLPAGISCVAEVDPGVGAVRGDATQLHRVLMNLCENARDALPQGGVVELRAAELEIDAAEARHIEGAGPGRYVRWTVADNGIGMSPQIRERIFEPFFSTKPRTKATGLGLSTVLGVVRSHGGFLQVHTREGAGSRFEVFLPLAQAGTPMSAAPWEVRTSV
jgi:PAS domain S-box-containing protein